MSPLVKQNVVEAERALKTLGYADVPFEHVVDVDCSARFRGLPKRLSPCLLYSRPRGMWLVHRQRRLSALETARLQGIGDGQLEIGLSDNAYRAACGIAMSVNVLTRIIARLLPHT